MLKGIKELAQRVRDKIDVQAGDRPDTTKLTPLEWLAVDREIITPLGRSEVEAVGREVLGDFAIDAYLNARDEAMSVIAKGDEPTYERKSLPPISKYQTKLLIGALEEIIPGADRDAKAAWLTARAIAAFPNEERRNQLFDYVLSRVAEAEDNPPQPPVDERDPEWRDGWDMATLRPVDDVILFQTKDVLKPEAMNEDGGAEYIISWLAGEGFVRCLIMAMGGGRQSRIFVEGGPSAGEHNNKFPTPLMGVHNWMIENVSGKAEIKLNGKVIFVLSGSVSEARMGGIPRRGFLGQWREGNYKESEA